MRATLYACMYVCMRVCALLVRAFVYQSDAAVECALSDFFYGILKKSNNVYVKYYEPVKESGVVILKRETVFRKHYSTTPWLERNGDQ